MEQNWTRSELALDGTGTVSGTAGSTTLTGSGTNWPHDMVPGMGILVDTDDDDVYEVALTISKIPSVTTIVVETAPSASFSDKPYQVAGVAYLPSFGQPGGQDSDRCAACGRTFPRKDLVYVGGLGYCRAYGHWKEIDEIKRRNRTRERSAGFRLKLR